MPKVKPRAPAYGLYVLDATRMGLRAWMDHRRKVVCTTTSVVPKEHGQVFVFNLRPVKPAVTEMIFSILSEWGYWAGYADRDLVQLHLGTRYDCANPWPVSAGPEAGIKHRRAVPEKATRRRRRGTTEGEASLF